MLPGSLHLYLRDLNLMLDIHMGATKLFAFGPLICCMFSTITFSIECAFSYEQLGKPLNLFPFW